MIYSGIGSRTAPDNILKLATYFGEVMANKGFTLRSGAADGMDAAFERGCDNVAGTKEIYLPWKNFNDHNSQLYSSPPRAFTIAKEYHPVWNRLSHPQKRFMARNTEQVLGELLFEPSDLVICYTKDGVENGSETTKETGGTGQCIRLSETYNIPVFNLKNEDTIDNLVKFLNQP